MKKAMLRKLNEESVKEWIKNNVVETPTPNAVEVKIELPKKTTKKKAGK